MRARRRRRFAIGAALSACVLVAGCGTSGERLLNPEDGIWLQPVEHRDEARVSFSGHKEVSSSGEVHVRCQFPIERQLHYEVARFQTFETQPPYPAPVVIAIVGLEIVGYAVFLPIWILLDLGSLNSRGEVFPAWLFFSRSHETRLVGEPFERKNVTTLPVRSDLPLEAADCSVEVLSESSEGARSIKNFSGVTGPGGDWFADLRELTSLLQPEDDVLLVKMRVVLPGDRVKEGRLYLTAREVRDPADR